MEKKPHIPLPRLLVVRWKWHPKRKPFQANTARKGRFQANLLLNWKDSKSWCKASGPRSQDAIRVLPTCRRNRMSGCAQSASAGLKMVCRALWPARTNFASPASKNGPTSPISAPSAESAFNQFCCQTGMTPVKSTLLSKLKIKFRKSPSTVMTTRNTTPLSSTRKLWMITAIFVEALKTRKSYWSVICATFTSATWLATKA